MLKGRGGGGGVKDTLVGVAVHEEGVLRGWPPPVKDPLQPKDAN